MAYRHFPDLDELLRKIETEAADGPDPLAILVALLKLVMVSDADPYLLAGALAEGIAATIAKKIPAARQGEVAVATVRLLRDRLQAHGAI
jgi:hypothetical protein